jgi:hypothetical protein
VTAMSSGHRHHHHQSLLGCLHDHDPVGALAALFSIECLRPWPS